MQTHPRARAFTLSFFHTRTHTYMHRRWCRSAANSRACCSHDETSLTSSPFPHPLTSVYMALFESIQLFLEYMFVRECLTLQLATSVLLVTHSDEREMMHASVWYDASQELRALFDMQSLVTTLQHQQDQFKHKHAHTHPHQHTHPHAQLLISIFHTCVTKLRAHSLSLSSSHTISKSQYQPQEVQQLV